jgi:hypothetical protein
MKSRIVLTVAVFTAFVLGIISFHPIARAVEILAATTCNMPGACIAGKNANGPGLLGSSAKGYGVSGQTTFPSKNGNKFGAGILGTDLSTTGKFDVGVWGSSTRGDAVLGTSTSSAGVYGASTSSIGVIGTSTKTTGVYGSVTGGSKPTGVYGQDNGNSGNGAGVAGQSLVGTGVIASTNSSSNGVQALLAAAPNGGYLFAGIGSGNYEVATIDGSGNMTISGQLFTTGSCQSGCAQHRIGSYAASAATPTLEDTGEGQLSGGSAYVRIDPSFANATDARLGYTVLITPEGDTRGVYVTQRTAAGFQVRENMGGHSTAPFAYRIVGHPFGARGTRLPLVQNRPAPAWRNEPVQMENRQQ